MYDESLVIDGKTVFKPAEPNQKAEQTICISNTDGTFTVMLIKKNKVTEKHVDEAGVLNRMDFPNIAELKKYIRVLQSRVEGVETQEP